MTGQHDSRRTAKPKPHPDPAKRIVWGAGLGFLLGPAIFLNFMLLWPTASPEPENPEQGYEGFSLFGVFGLLFIFPPMGAIIGTFLGFVYHFCAQLIQRIRERSSAKN